MFNILEKISENFKKNIEKDSMIEKNDDYNELLLISKKYLSSNDSVQYVINKDKNYQYNSDLSQFISKIKIPEYFNEININTLLYHDIINVFLTKTKEELINNKKVILNGDFFLNYNYNENNFINIKTSNIKKLESMISEDNLNISIKENNLTLTELNEIENKTINLKSGENGYSINKKSLEDKKQRLLDMYMKSDNKVDFIKIYSNEIVNIEDSLEMLKLSNNIISNRIELHIKKVMSEMEKGNIINNEKFNEYNQKIYSILKLNFYNISNDGNEIDYIYLLKKNFKNNELLYEYIEKVGQIIDQVNTDEIRNLLMAVQIENYIENKNLENIDNNVIDEIEYFSMNLLKSLEIKKENEKIKYFINNKEYSINEIYDLYDLNTNDRKNEKIKELKIIKTIRM